MWITRAQKCAYTHAFTCARTHNSRTPVLVCQWNFVLMLEASSLLPLSLCTCLQELLSYHSHSFRWQDVVISTSAGSLRERASAVDEQIPIFGGQKLSDNVANKQKTFFCDFGQFVPLVHWATTHVFGKISSLGKELIAGKVPGTIVYQSQACFCFWPNELNLNVRFWKPLAPILLQFLFWALFFTHSWAFSTLILVFGSSFAHKRSGSTQLWRVSTLCVLFTHKSGTHSCAVVACFLCSAQTSKEHVGIR